MLTTLPLDSLADRVLLGNQDPRIFETLLVAERDPLLLAVEAKDDDVDLVSDLEVLAGVADPAPRNVRDVQQPVETAEIDEDTVVGDVLDGPVDQLALFEAGHGVVFDLALLFFEDRLARQHDVGPAAIKRDDLGFDLLLEVVFEPPVRAADRRATREGSADADVNGQPSLDPFEDLPAAPALPI